MTEVAAVRSGVPLSKRVMTSALTLAGLGRLSMHHDVSLAALVYVLAVFVGHP